MTEKNIISAQQRYNNLVSEQNELKRIKMKMLELENDPNVRKYNDLVNFLKTKQEYNQDNLIKKSFSFPISYSKGDRILVFMGDFYSDNSLYFMNTNKNKQPNSCKYRDLETGEYYFIDLNEKKNFEEKNNILHLDLTYLNNSSLTLFEKYENAYQKVQLNYLGSFLSQEQNNAQDIYVYMGSYYYDHIEDAVVFYGDDGGNYYKYINLQTGEIEFVKKEEKEKFEKNYNVKYLDLKSIKYWSERTEEEYDQKFVKLRTEVLEGKISNKIKQMKTGI